MNQISKRQDKFLRLTIAKRFKKVTIPIFCNIVENYNIKDKWYICYP